MFCYKCGTQTMADAQWCGRCGAALHAPVTSPPPLHTPQPPVLVMKSGKSAGLAVEDRIALMLGGDAELLAAARAHEDYVSGETLATSISYDGAGTGEPASIEGRELHIAVKRA